MTIWPTLKGRQGRPFLLWETMAAGWLTKVGLTSLHAHDGEIEVL